MRRHPGGSTKLTVIVLAMLMAFSFSLPFSGCDQKVEVPTSRATKRKPKRGNRPQIAVGGGGAPAANASTEAAAEAPPAVSTVVNIEGGLENGFYPQMSLSFKQNGFGGGLVPDFRNPVASADAASDQASAQTTGDVDDLVNETTEEAIPEGFMASAIDAFIARRDADGFKYLYANYLSDDETAQKYQLNWYPGIKQPKLALRFGVGVAYSSPKGFEGKPPVIGDPEDVRLPGANSRSGQRRQSGRGGSIGAGGGGGAPGGGSTGSATSPYANVDTSQTEGFLLYYTGDFGDRLLTRLESRRLHDDSFYGQIIKDLGVDFSVQQVSASTNRPTSTPRSGRGRGIGTAGGGGAAPGGGGGGVIGAGGGANNNSTATRTERLDRVNGRSAAADPDGELSGSLSPGVMLVGQGKKNDLIARAREMGLDVLLLFNVRVSSGRTPTGTAGLKVYNLHSEEDDVIFNSASLRSDVVAKKRDSGVDEESDPVAVALDKVFKEMLDEQFKAQPMPSNLKPEHVAGRIKQLMTKSHPDPLSVAVEVIAFHRAEMIDAELAESALDEILGEGKGSILLTGTSDERRAALEDFLPGSDDDSGDDFR